MEHVREHLQLALGSAQMAVWDSSLVAGEVMASRIHWSADGMILLGLAPHACRMLFRDFLSFMHPDDRDPVVRLMQAQVDIRGGYDVSYRIRRKDGEERWLRARACTQSDAAGASGTLGLIWDDSERKQMELTVYQQKELAEITLASIGDAVITTDAQGCIRSLNRVAEQLTGWAEGDAAGKDIDALMHLVDDISGAVVENPVHRCLHQHSAIGVSSHTQLMTRDGRTVSIEDAAAPIWSREDRLFGVVAVFRDVSHERQLAHQVRWQAGHDALTGLINRREFEAEVARALAGAKEEGQRHAMLYLDLDQFKIVNDSCGHAAGDVLLQMLSRMLQDHMRDSDILARLGGDELGMLLTHCPLPRALALAENIRQAVRDFRFVWGDRTFQLGVSVGLVEIDRYSKSMTELLVAADQVCYVAKETGRNRIHVYRESDVLLARRRGEVKWVTRLNDALAHDRFRLFAQPIVGLNGTEGRHEEVLIRIVDVDNKLILPGAFIPAAERYDLMATLDRWVIAHVCLHMAQEAVRKPAAAPIVYSINLSGVSLNDEGMFDHIVDQFGRHGIDPCRICFEITETAIIANLPKAQDFIAQVRALGCQFSLDDFGSGLSSFAYLRALQVDFLKIDGVFVRGIADNPINRAMVNAINDVGHVMGIRTVAEYVEDRPTLDVVRALGIDFAQGYAVGRLHRLGGVSVGH
jgi:diguanylate cyclase (GGDEF)-like protein/PAS domain S-box-containing protein